MNQKKDVLVKPERYAFIGIAAIFMACAVHAQQSTSGGIQAIDGGSRESQTNHVDVHGSAAPYEFKMARLGMSLEEFKRVASGELVDRPLPGHTIFGGLRMKKFPTPLCTDSTRAFEGDPLLELKKGEVVCNASPGDVNQNLGTVAGRKLRYITYSFYDGKLYKISLQMPPSTFAAVVDAFSKKYGVPLQSGSDSYQNGFGATWSVAKFVWKRGRQTIAVKEGVGRGPGQFDDGTGVIMDPSFGPPAPPQQPLDF
ncbi:hypothetical protein ACPPVV_02695 [Rhodanobacter sp. Col0626]|uniref:hypothetical protein n=1 Tax=Rhodanobacter sp. Col0626 TaxID=3415679 RepID=UPI003CEAF812